MSKLRNWLTKLSENHYLNVYIVLAADLIISVIASSLAILSSNLFYPIVGFDNSVALLWTLVGLVAEVILFYFLKTYRATIRHSSLRDVGKLFLAAIGKFVALVIFGYIYFRYPTGGLRMPFLAVVDISITFGLFMLIRVCMIVVYDFVRGRVKESEKQVNVLVASYDVNKAAAMVERLQNSPHYKIMGFITANEEVSSGRLIKGLPVFVVPTEEDLKPIVVKLDVRGVIFVGHETARRERERLVEYAKHLKVSTLIAPEIEEAVAGAVMTNNVRAIKIEDLLGREEIKISMDEITKSFAGKTVMVTGAAGSIGSELVRQLATFGVEKLILFDNAETPMHYLRLELEDRFKDLKFVPVIGDVRQIPRLDFVFRTYHPQVVFHAAAYKHVPLMEENPCEAVLVNCYGSRNVANKCIEYGVEKMVMISTDKAVNPTNVMGCTKRVAEIYVQSLGLAIEVGRVAGKTKFVTTRFGNVLGSNGSVIPRFREQIEHGGPVTVTHPEINRFFMTIPEACRLVMEAAILPSENKICVFDMGESVKIVHLAERMIELAGFKPYTEIPIAFTGLRPGEKLYEEVLADTENTIPTSHEKIRLAKIRESYKYEDVDKTIDTLEELSYNVDIPQMLKVLKALVPEYSGRTE